MKIIDRVHSFNSRRAYAHDGQEIVWAIIDRGPGVDAIRYVVAFCDLARGIDGVIDLHFGNLDRVTDSWLLRAYDDMHYHHGFEEVQLLREARRRS